jgi:hypothetical protein
MKVLSDNLKARALFFPLFIAVGKKSVHDSPATGGVTLTYMPKTRKFLTV